MAKGQTIGGGGQGAAPPRRGGMLPPSGAGPVEVTPEWLEQQRRAETESSSALAPVAATHLPGQKAEAAPAAGAVEVALPDRNTNPADQLAVCERAVHDAKARWTAKAQAATEAFIAEAGPFLAWVHEHKLYKLMLDASGKPYRSFAKYLKEQHDLNRRTGYRITQTIPLLNILARGGHQLPDLSSRQVDALHPVRTQHDDASVLKVWETAWATKKGPLPTPEELEKAKQLLALVTKPDEEAAAELTSGVADPSAAVERAEKILVPATLREAVKKDPNRIRGLVRVLNAALTEAGEPVD